MSSRDLYFRLLSHLRPYLGIFLLSILGMAITAASEPIFPALVQLMLHTLDNSYAQKYPHLTVWIPPASIPVLIIVLFIIRGIAQLLSNYCISRVGNQLVMDLRAAMFSKLIALPSHYFSDHATGNLISKLTYDVTQVTSAATNVVTVGIKDSLTILGLLIYLFFVNWKLTLVSVAMAPFMAIIMRIVSKRLRKVSRDSQHAMGNITSVIEESIENQRVIKIFGGQQYESNRFSHAINRIRLIGMKQAIAAALNTPFVELLAACSLSIIMAMAYSQAATDKTTAVDFIGFIIGMLLLFAPLKRLSSVNEPLQRGLAAAESVFDLIDEMPEEDKGSVNLGHAKGHIEFRNVSFSYQSDGLPTLNNINLTIEPGETIALVGASGSGKTTLANMIPRFFHPTSGEILIDGTLLEEISLESLRENIALVSQEVLLFNDTVAANIAYGKLAETNDEKILAAAEAAHAEEFISQMPNDFKTIIGENGTRLSGGQRQRLAIARALLKNAPILILDEATSALDTASERHVQAALETLMKGRTTIVIAHRLTTIERANRIVVLNKGKIVEVGSHQQLIDQGGMYANLHQMQRVHETVVTQK